MRVEILQVGRWMSPHEMDERAQLPSAWTVNALGTKRTRKYYADTSIRRHTHTNIDVYTNSHTHFPTNTFEHISGWERKAGEYH